MMKPVIKRNLKRANCKLLITNWMPQMKKFLIQRILCKASSRTSHLTMNLPLKDCKMKKAKKPRQQINPNNPNLLPLMN